uniref:F-box domain-containing protein n=1 Tax=Anopheles melas TaxID=34690 RepID=A0A182TLU2_9DIPT
MDFSSANDAQSMFLSSSRSFSRRGKRTPANDSTLMELSIANCRSCFSFQYGSSPPCSTYCLPTTVSTSTEYQTLSSRRLRQSIKLGKMTYSSSLCSVRLTSFSSIMYTIFDYLSIYSLREVSLTCHYWERLISEYVATRLTLRIGYVRSYDNMSYADLRAREEAHLTEAAKMLDCTKRRYSKVNIDLMEEPFETRQMNLVLSKLLVPSWLQQLVVLRVGLGKDLQTFAVKISKAVVKMGCLQELHLVHPANGSIRSHSFKELKVVNRSLHKLVLHLKKLYYHASIVSSEVLQAICESCVQLKDLHLLYLASIGPNPLRHLSHLNMLQQLSICCSANILSFAGVRLPRLERLLLYDMKIDWPSLAELTSIKWLKITPDPSKVDQICDLFAGQLSSQLNFLWLAMDYVDVYACLPKLSALKTLVVENVNQQFSKYLPRLPQLTQLFLIPESS